MTYNMNQAVIVCFTERKWRHHSQEWPWYSITQSVINTSLMSVSKAVDNFWSVSSSGGTDPVGGRRSIVDKYASIIVDFCCLITVSIRWEVSVVFETLYKQLKLTFVVVYYGLITCDLNRWFDKSMYSTIKTFEATEAYLTASYYALSLADKCKRKVARTEPSGVDSATHIINRVGDQQRHSSQESSSQQSYPQINRAINHHSLKLVFLLAFEFSLTFALNC